MMPGGFDQKPAYVAVAGLGDPALTAALAGDPLRPRFLGFTALGLAEIARPRVRAPLHEMLSGPLAAGLSFQQGLDQLQPGQDPSQVGGDNPEPGGALR